MLSQEQSDAVELSKKRSLVLVTGIPGSGKSKTIKRMVEAREEAGGAVLLGTTANAVDRIFQSTGIRAEVVDAALYSKDLSKYRGKRIIIDEAGMLSTEKASEIIARMKPSALILVGDAHQLPCVSGLPALGTMMRIPGVPHARLTKSFRRDVSEKAALDRAIDTLGTDDFNVKDQDDTFRVFLHDTQEKCYEAAVAEYRKRPCQLLAYTVTAVHVLNAATEDTTKQMMRPPTRDGDRVVCTKNLYVKKTLKVANGTCGTASKDTGVTYDNGFVDATLDSEFVPCRCMTVHKSQGNEYDVHGVVVVCPWKGPPPIELLYTAISRFRKSVSVHVARSMAAKTFGAAFADVYDEGVIEDVSELSFSSASN